MNRDEEGKDRLTDSDTDPGARPGLASGPAPDPTPDDPLRAVRLMWDPPPPPTRGPKPKLDVERIVAAAVRVADEAGVDALSMRKVAAALGVGAMSLYTYVASKAELVELMVDRVHAEIAPPDPAAGWREQATDAALQAYRMYHRHPWILQTNLLRLGLGPNVLDASEHLLAALEGLGLDATDVFHSATLVGSYVRGAARGSIIEGQTVDATGVDVDDYYAARQEFWERYFDVERYPVHTRLWNRGAFDDAVTDPFRFGLERILDGIEALKARGG